MWTSQQRRRVRAPFLVPPERNITSNTGPASSSGGRLSIGIGGAGGIRRGPGPRALIAARRASNPRPLMRRSALTGFRTGRSLPRALDDL